MKDDRTAWDWNGVSNETVREIVRMAEAQLADLLAASLAADQRAVNQAGILAGFGAALLAAAATFASGTHMAVCWGVLIAGIGFVTSAFVSGIAARPVDYQASGYEPEKLMPAARDSEEMMRGVAEDMQARIAHNRAVLTKTARLTGVATSGALVAIALGVLVFAALQSFTPSAPVVDQTF